MSEVPISQWRSPAYGLKNRGEDCRLQRQFYVGSYTSPIELSTVQNRNCRHKIVRLDPKRTLYLSSHCVICLPNPYQRRLIAQAAQFCPYYRTCPTDIS